MAWCHKTSEMQDTGGVPTICPFQLLEANEVHSNISPQGHTSEIYIHWEQVSLIVSKGVFNFTYRFQLKLTTRVVSLSIG